MAIDKKEERFVPRKGMVSYDEFGHKVVKVKVIRPITDPEWNRRQMGKRVRMSKKQRLAERRRIEASVK